VPSLERKSPPRRKHLFGIVFAGCARIARGASARISWARLTKRVFDLDCGQCGGKMRIIAAIEEPAVIERILTQRSFGATAASRAGGAWTYFTRLDSQTRSGFRLEPKRRARLALVQARAVGKIGHWEAQIPGNSDISTHVVFRNAA
jgi:hypothetical protein